MTGEDAEAESPSLAKGIMGRETSKPMNRYSIRLAGKQFGFEVANRYCP